MIMTVTVQGGDEGSLLPSKNGEDVGLMDSRGKGDETVLGGPGVRWPDPFSDTPAAVCGAFQVAGPERGPIGPREGKPCLAVGDLRGTLVGVQGRKANVKRL